jgi:acetyl esterase/lipase
MGVRKDQVFAEVDGKALKLDIFDPEGAPNRTAILYLHGGGWRQGSREFMAPIARIMAARGFTGAAVQYRLIGDAPWPAQIHDVKAAIRWTRRHASELNVDPERIVLWGHSAGAHLALLAAGALDHPALEGDVGPLGVSSKVAAAIAVHAPTKFHVGRTRIRASTNANTLLGEAATEEAARAASPITYASVSFPPVLLLHGALDRIVHVSQSQAMADALLALEACVDLHIFHGFGHGFTALPSVRRQVAAEAAFFLDRTVVAPHTHREELERRGRPAPAAAELSAIPRGPTSGR